MSPCDDMREAGFLVDSTNHSSKQSDSPSPDGDDPTGLSPSTALERTAIPL
jgi:hypothetical protein